MPRKTKAEREADKMREDRRTFENLYVQVYIDGMKPGEISPYLLGVAKQQEFDPDRPIHLDVVSEHEYGDEVARTYLLGSRRRNEEELAAYDKLMTAQTYSDRMRALDLIARLKREYPEEFET